MRVVKREKAQERCWRREPLDELLQEQSAIAADEQGHHSLGLASTGVHGFRHNAVPAIAERRDGLVEGHDEFYFSAK